MSAKLLNNFSNFTSSIIRAIVPSFSGMLSVKAGRPLVNWFKRSILLVIGKVTTSWIAVSISFIRTIYAIARKSGVRFLVSYLKASVSLLMQAIAGTKHSSTRPLKAAVSRTSSGIPRIIPRLHRAKIREGSVLHIRVWLTFLSVYRVLDYTGKLSIKTIVAPSDYNYDKQEVAVAVHRFRRDFNLPALTPYSSFNTVRGFWIPTTSPNSTKSELSQGAPSTASTSMASLLGSIAFWSKEENQALFRMLQRFLLVFRVDYKFSFFISMFGTIARHLGDSVWTSSAGTVELKTLYSGKLGYKLEPAGKVRVFAMVDAFTQWVLSPLHKRLFTILRLLPMDATHDQSQTIETFIRVVRRKGIRKIYSFDLTAATDRMPVEIQALILDLFDGPIAPLCEALYRPSSFSLGETWRSLLVDRWYQLPPIHWAKAGDPPARRIDQLGFTEEQARANPNLLLSTVDFDSRTGRKVTPFTMVKAVRYAVGQPMGALSSWAMLALTHHVMVAIAAHRANEARFTDYMVLGDDLVIANPRVAREYLTLAKQWGIEINLSKSVISYNGSFEFAKRFIFKYVDVSGLSFREMAVARYDIRGLTQLFERISSFRKIRITEILAFLGFGYKSLSRMTTRYSKLGGRMAKLLLLLSYPGERFSSLTSYSSWVLSHAFNKAGIVRMPQSAVDFLNQLLLVEVTNIKDVPVPSSGEEMTYEFTRSIWGAGYDDFSSSEWIQFVREGRLPKAGIRDFDYVEEAFGEFLLPFYKELHQKVDTVRIRSRAKFESEDENTSFDMLWDRLDAIADIKEMSSNVSFHVSNRELLTLNGSVALKRAANVRKGIVSLSSRP